MVLYLPQEPSSIPFCRRSQSRVCHDRFAFHHWREGVAGKREAADYTAEGVADSIAADPAADHTAAGEGIGSGNYYSDSCCYPGCVPRVQASYQEPSRPSRNVSY